MPTLISSLALAPGIVTADKIAANVELGGPKVSSLDYPGDDTAALPEGGQTIAVNGSGFQSGCVIYIDGSVVSVVTYISSTVLTFVAPAKATGLYPLYVVNPDGGTAIAVPGMVYSGTPTWTTASGSLGTPYETTSFSVSLSATGDGALSYAVTSGSSLPAGLSLSSAGALTGTVPATASDTTYTFNVDVIDAENQSTTRQFSITYKVDVVTWSSPAAGASFTWDVGSANSTSLVATSAAGKSVSFTVQSGSLPTGIAISGSNISGTATVAQANTSVIIRATAADTARYTDRTFYYTAVAQEEPYWNNVTLLVKGNGSDGSTTFVDESPLSQSITRFVEGTGSSSVTTDSPKYGTGSIRFVSSTVPPDASWNNNRGGFSVPYHSSYNLRSNGTIEFWVRVRNLVTNPSFGTAVHPIVNLTNGSNPAFIIWVYGGAVRAALYGTELPPGYSGSYSVNAGTGSDIVLNTWYHYALVRQNDTFTFYENGISRGSHTLGNVWPNIVNLTNCSGSPLRFGWDSGYAFSGSNIDLDDIRISNIARYTSNFTPPTAELGQYL